MSISNEYTGERLSFFNIFSQKKYKLIIPIIQRDYAQGRITEDTNDVRNEFLDTLYKYLKENRPNRDLDFIYGTIQEDNETGQIHFIPLDGQQRLTTLFLLHWFLFQLSKNEEAKNIFKTTMMNGGKSLFSYETRQSSADFCDALMQATIDMEQLKTIKDEYGEDTPSLTATITNKSWFFRSWKNDPTIQSMLVMLDAIYQKFIGNEDFFEKLLDEQHPIITFIFMDLKKYKLTDDLYIKMNSRGKPLSKFENFKAKFEQYIKKIDENNLRKFILKFKNEEKAVNLHQYFSFNIDTKWTNLIWQYCKNGKEGKLDSSIENLFRIIITNHYASVVKLQKNHTSDAAFDILISEVKSLTFTNYEETKALTYNAVLAVIDSFDALYNDNQTIAHYISSDYKTYYDEDEIFIKAIENKLSRAERMQFFAYVQYLILHKDKTNGLNEWMRIIHNLTHPDNTITDGNDDFARGIKSIKKLLPHAPTIIKYLQKTTIDGFSKHQSSEECIKAHLVEREEWKNLIEDTEKHPYFNGQIGFMLEFAGIVDYYSKNKNLNWSKKEDTIFKNAFIKYSTISKHIFYLRGNTRFNNVNYCFERAVLAHGDYLPQWRTDYHWNILSTETAEKNIKRDLSWKRMLRMSDDNKSKELVKATFDDITDLADITASLEKLCIPQTEDTWRNILISSPKMIEVCKKGFIYFGEEILLLTNWYLNHYHYELFTYHLWTEKFENKINFEGFEEQEYAWQKRSDISPHILIKDFLYKYNRYSIKIYAVLNQNSDFDKFQIRFGFNNENKFDYPDTIIELMQKLSFKNDDKSVNWFSRYCSSENRAFKKTKELAESLSQLKQK